MCCFVHWVKIWMISRVTIDWDRLYNDHMESHARLNYMPFKNKNIKYLSYFDEIEIHSNNEMLKTKNDINCLVYGYVKQNTKDIYDLSGLIKLIVKYFGPPANQSIFTVLRKNTTGYKNVLLRNMSGHNCNDIHHLEMGHLYRTIIFNKPLTKNSVKLSIIRLNVCDYWKKHCWSQTSLGFGFAIGVIQVDLNEEIALNCHGNKNPLSLSNNMDFFATDLVGLYYESIKSLTAAHFVFDTNKNCFVYKTLFNFPKKDQYPHRKFGLSNIQEGIHDENQTSTSFDSKQEYIELDQSIEMHAEYVGYTWDLRSPDWSIFLIVDSNRIDLGKCSEVIGIIGDNVWLPVVSCVGCNCPSCSDSPLVLALTTSDKNK